jgi:predicted acetylornithine/succinylornithine family transaminase
MARRSRQERTDRFWHEGKTMTTAQQVKDLESRHVLQTYKRQPLVLVRGEGRRLYDIEGRAYLDFLSGIGVVVLGHSDQGLAEVVEDQARTLIHTSNLYYHPLQGQLAAKLAALSGLERSFFCNSGTEAVEACLKFARRFWFSQGEKTRTEYVALHHGFSGRTMGALSVTANPHYREPFGPLSPGVTFVAPDDVAGLEAAVTARTAAIIAEPIQGEGGVRPLPTEFAAAVQRVTERTGALLIADEIQCGLGRTGRPFHFEAFGWKPDLITVGKAIGSGVPVGAALVSSRIAAQIFAGDHGTTYGGNLLATRAALYVLGRITGTTDPVPYSGGGLIDHVRTVGPIFAARLDALRQKHAIVESVRGDGVMRGLELSVDAAAVVEGALKRGLLVNRTAEKVVRMLPPFTVTEPEIDEAASILDAALAEAGR